MIELVELRNLIERRNVQRLQSPFGCVASHIKPFELWDASDI